MSNISPRRLEEEWCTPSQAANLLGVSRQRVYQLIEERRIRSVYVGGAHSGRGVLVCDVESVGAVGREMSTRDDSPAT